MRGYVRRDVKQPGRLDGVDLTVRGESAAVECDATQPRGWAKEQTAVAILSCTRVTALRRVTSQATMGRSVTVAEGAAGEGLARWREAEAVANSDFGLEVRH